MQFRRILVILLCVIFVSLFGYIIYKEFLILGADKTWIIDFGYNENEVHDLTFNWPGERSCPRIPIKVNDKEYEMGFDTGCGSKIFFTNVIENDIDYTLVKKIEELNRDGTHRGWGKHVLIDDITVYGTKYNNINASISNWELFSSRKFNGTIGLAYFQSKIVTLDYTGRKIAVGSHSIDYSKLSLDKYIVLPLYRSTEKNQEDLPFFEAEYNGNPIMVYLDTGKNYSYINNLNSAYSMADKPTKLVDIPLRIKNMEIVLKDVAEINDLAQAEGLPYPTMIELNSDQIWKCNLLVTFDLIEQKIIFRRK